MAQHLIQSGSTSNTMLVKLRSATTGALLGSVAYGSVTAKRQRSGEATATTVSLVDGTLGTFVSSGWKETQIAGVYQFCPADSALTAGAAEVVYTFSATSAIDAVEHVILTGQSGQVPTVGSGTGQINLSGGKAPATLATADVSGNLNAQVKGVDANAITATAIAASALDGKGDWNIGKTGYSLSTAGVQAIWDALTSALTTVGSVGKLIVDKITGLTFTTTNKVDASANATLAQDDISSIASSLATTLAGQTIQINSPIASDGSIEIIQGNDYSGSEALTFTDANYTGTSMSGGTVSMAIMEAADYEADPTTTPVLTAVGTVTQSGTTVTVSIPLTAAQTAALDAAPPSEAYSHVYEVRVVTSVANGSKKITKWLGGLNVKRGAFA